MALTEDRTGFHSTDICGHLKMVWRRILGLSVQLHYTTVAFMFLEGSSMPEPGSQKVTRNLYCKAHREKTFITIYSNKTQGNDLMKLVSISLYNIPLWSLKKLQGDG